MSLWWLQQGWTSACCAQCGAKIWPEGDPDWGLCWPCKSDENRTRGAEDEWRAQQEQDSADSTWENYTDTMRALAPKSQ